MTNSAGESPWERRVPMAFSAAALAVAAWAAVPPSRVTAEAFLLRDADGVVHGEFSMNEAGVGSLVLGKAGVRYVTIVSGPRPGIELRDDQGVERAALAVVSDPNGSESAGLVFRSPGGKPSLRVGGIGNDRAGFDLFDRAGNHRATFRIEADGTPHIELFTPGGAGGLSLVAAADQRSQIIALDAERRPRVTLGVRGGNPEILCSEADGAERFRAPPR